MKTVALMLLLCASPRAQAQNLPEVEVVTLLQEKRPHMLAAQVAVADCYSSALSGAQREELARVNVTLRGPWERTAQHLASEKAAELGANCLSVLSSSGEDGRNYPVIRRYKAFRVTIPYGPWRVLASVQSMASASAAATGQSVPTLAQMPVLKVPVIKRKSPERHGDHLGRAMGNAVYFHEVVLEPSRAVSEVWQDVAQDVREYFGDAEHLKLGRFAEAKKTVIIDLRSGKTRAHEAIAWRDDR